MKTTAAVPKPFLDLLPHRATSDLVREIERNAQWLHDTKARGVSKGTKYADKLKVVVKELQNRLPKLADDEKTEVEAAISKAKAVLLGGDIRASAVEAAPYDGWKDLKPGKLATPIELEDAEGLWKAIAERIGHDPEKGVEMRAPIIGGRRRYHHRPLRSYHLSNDRTLTLTTDELEAKTWNNLKAKRHPAMPRVYDTFSVKKKGEKEAKLWAIVHEQLVWPIEENWNLFVDSFFKWRAMEREALSPAKATDLEGFLRWVIDPEQADPSTTQKNRIEVVLPWKMTRQRRDDVADRRKKLFALPDLEEKIKWAKSALQYLKQNKVKFRDFDPSNLAMTKKGDRVVITNLAESRSIPTKTGRTGRVKGSASSTAPVRGVTVYHGTNNKFEKFDFSKSNDVGIWFTSDPEAIKRNEVGSQGNKYIREHSLTLNNPAGWDEYDRLTLSELIQRGYDGVVMPDEDKVNYLVFHPECIGKRGEIPTGLVTKHTSALTDKSVEELQAMDTEDLDRLAFGVTSGDVIEVDPSDILIQYKSDLSNPEEKFRTGGTKWLKSVDLSDPVDVEVHKDGKLYLADGHHRWFAASKLGKKLRALVEVKANPVVYLTEGPRRRLELVGAYTEQSRIGVLGDVYASNNEELPEHRAIAEVDVSDLSETRCVIALSKDMIMGIATWDDELEALEIVKVDKSFRRQGVASALIEAAEEAHGGPLTDTGERSAEGEAMLRKLGRRPAPLSRRIDEREAESLGAMLIARLYRSLANGSFKERVKSDWQPF
jgi:GNAT superfamily N-acetyltransferase